MFVGCKLVFCLFALHGSAVYFTASTIVNNYSNTMITIVTVAWLTIDRQRYTLVNSSENESIHSALALLLEDGNGRCVLKNCTSLFSNFLSAIS